ncbi:sensor histidine kinase [Segetibacter koreensis]|uniref:sensor histidine kinase n=1 Tax=Segetibacter koreensis TaxID=398037 RepID=UPI0003693FD5|nr:HAMP domain-containing sensor histidine kinase [Segetibacter koreensis]
MKLLTRYNRANLITAIVILLVSSITYYFIIRSILIQQIDKDLKVEEQEIHEYIKENNSLPNASAYKGQEIRFEPSPPSSKVKRKIVTTVPDTGKDEDEPVRMLVFPVFVKGVLHKAIVIKSQVEAEGLVKLIVLVTAAIFLLLLVIIWLINRLLLSKLWEPFYYTLQQLTAYDLKHSKVLKLPLSEINEFNELNKSVSEMTSRVNRDFESLKTFTDNASHEMQTPLAIINSKLDILLQSSNEKQAEQLQTIYNATGRLSRLNQALLLLTKINNEQYSRQNKVDLKNLIEQKLQQFEELITARNIKLRVELAEVFIDINEELADILFNNLFSNAVKHNYSNGYINCFLTPESITISNSGPPLTFDPKQIFNRFQKGDHSSGTGLGLAVVQQICENSNFTITYASGTNEHAFTIIFNAKHQTQR